MTSLPYSVDYGEKYNEMIRSGGNSKYYGGNEDPDSLSNQYWRRADATAGAGSRLTPQYGGSGDGNKGNPPPEPWRGQALRTDLANPLLAEAARRAGVKSFDSEEDVARAQNYLLDGAGKSPAPASSGSAAAPKQAVEAAKAWQDQSGGGAAGQRITPGGYGGGPSGGSTANAGWGSLARDVAGDFAQRGNIYGTIARIGDDMTEGFRSIGRSYYNNAFNEGAEIKRATDDAVASLSPDIQLTDYINPLRKGYGATIGLTGANRNNSMWDILRDQMDG